MRVASGLPWDVLQPSGLGVLHWGSLGTTALPTRGFALRATGEFRPSPFISSKQSTTGSSLGGTMQRVGPSRVPRWETHMLYLLRAGQTRHPTPRLLYPQQPSQARDVDVAVGRLPLGRWGGCWLPIERSVLIAARFINIQIVYTSHLGSLLHGKQPSGSCSRRMEIGRCLSRPNCDAHPVPSRLLDSSELGTYLLWAEVLPPSEETVLRMAQGLRLCA